jgi:dTDP-glucose 4,6-dehydratase
MDFPFEDMTKIVEERLGQDKAYVIDSTKARSEFNWRPKITLDRGIDGVVEWIDRYWDEIKLLPHEYVHQP